MISACVSEMYQSAKLPRSAVQKMIAPESSAALATPYLRCRFEDTVNCVRHKAVALGGCEQLGVVRQISQELAGVGGADQAVQAPNERRHAARDRLAGIFFFADRDVGGVQREIHGGFVEQARGALLKQ